MALPFGMIPSRRVSSVNFGAPLVLEPPRYCGLSSIALIPGRHLIGSALDCGIRLCSEGVQERHALILVGENRTVVKAMDSRTWVNDGPVTEIALRNGDRLSVGPVTFRVRLATAEEAAAFEAPPLPTAIEPPVLPPLPFYPPQLPPLAANSRTALTTREMNGEDVPDNPYTVPSPTNDAVPTPTMADEDRAAGPSAVQIPSVTTGMSEVTAPVVAVEPIVISDLERKAESVRSNPPSGREETAAAHQALPAPKPIAFRPHPSEVLNSRLDEIQLRLDELLNTSEFVHPESRASRLDPEDVVRNSHVEFQLRQDELSRRADELDARASKLQLRSEGLAERESQVERQQEALVHEAGRLSNVAETARLHIMEEHRRLSTQWKEWDQKYHQSTLNLVNQCDALEREREELRREAEQLSAMQIELQRLRADCDQDRRMNSSERARLAVEFAELQASKTQLDAERRQQSSVIDELEARVTADRQALIRDQERLIAERNEFERTKALFEEARLANAQRTDTDFLAESQNPEQIHSFQTLRQELEQERNQLAVERHALESLRNNLGQTSQQSSAESQELETLRRELEDERSRLSVERQSLESLRTDFGQSSQQISTERQNLATMRQELEDERSRLAEERQTLESLKLRLDEESRQVLTKRQEVETLQNEVQEVETALRTEKNQANPIPVDSTLVSHSVPAVSDVVDTGVFSHPFDQGNLGITSLPMAEPLLPFPSANDRFIDRTETSHPEFWKYDAPRAPEVEQVTPTLPHDPPAMSAPSEWPVSMTADDPFHSTPGFSTSDFDAVGGFAFGFDASRDVAPSVSYATVPNLESSSVSTLDLDHSPSGLDGSISANSPSIGGEEWKFGIPQANWGAVVNCSSELTSDTPWVSERAGDVEGTLEAVNRQFGVPVSNELVTEVPAVIEPDALPSWWKADPVEAEAESFPSIGNKTSEIAPLTTSEYPVESLTAKLNRETASAPPDPMEDLRSQLAKMFDLSPDATAGGSHPESNPTEVVEQVPLSPLQMPMIQEFPKTQVPAPSAAQADQEPVVEDSVEAFMARLLARSRGDGPASTSQPAAVSASPVFVAEKSESDLPAETKEQVDSSTDRSHLLAEPKHKQNKTEVRENLQSFRQVAHLSARSALARHSMRQLRNATIAKGALLGASLAAAVFFLSEPLFGKEMELWKAGGCWVAALLAGLEFRRSVNQLRNPATNPQSDLATNEAKADEPVDLESPAVLPFSQEQSKYSE